MAIGPPASPTALLPAAPPRFSLLSVPGVVLPGDLRWASGISTESEKCTVPLGLTGALTSDVPYWWQCTAAGGTTPETAYATRMNGTKRVAQSGDLLLSEPYWVWAGYACTATDAAGRRDEIDAKLTRRLAAITPVAVERELWTGAVAATAGMPNDAFTDAGTLTNLGWAGFVSALGELEQALAERNVVGRSMIHAQPRVVNQWASRGLVGPNADRTALVTAQGTVVVPGHGYPGSSPSTINGGAVGTYSSSYAYGTSWVNVWLGPIETTAREIAGGTVTRTTNDLEVRAERLALAIWDPCVHVGVRVSLCDEYCGPGS